MKKIVAMLLATVMLFAFAGCKSKEENLRERQRKTEEAIAANERALASTIAEMERIKSIKAMQDSLAN